jgi:hypothetical protein
MTLRILLLTAALFAAPAARADECRKLEEVAKILAESGGGMRPLTTRELDFARGLFVAQPNTPALMPEGDSGLWVTNGERVMVVFTRHGAACEMLGIGRDGVRNFERLGQPAGEPS